MPSSSIKSFPLSLAVLFFGLAGLLSAQDVGMGIREAGAKRLETPYSREVATPHRVWYGRLPGGPLRLLAVPSVQEGRTLIELAQRMPLELTTVTIDSEWDNNKWTMAFEDDYGARAEEGDLKLVYSYLEEELTSPKEFDVILLPLHHGWDALTERSREALKERVRRGCGLVLIRPMASALSPLEPVELAPSRERPYSEIEPRTESSPWEIAADHYLTRAIPLESFPFHLIENYRYRETKDAQILVKSRSGHPVLATGKYGKGRVVAFGYQNTGLSWRMSWKARLEPVDVYWEYFYALLCRSLVFAAGREPGEGATVDPAGQDWRLRALTGEVVRQGKGVPPQFEGLAAGRYFLEEEWTGDWRVTLVDRPSSVRVGDVDVRPGVISAGDRVTVEFQSDSGCKVELMDGFKRVIARTESPASAGRKRVELTAGTPLTHGGAVRITCGTSSKNHPVLFAASDREWSDYEVIMPWYGPRSYQPWVPALDAQFRKIGITTLADPERNFKIIASTHDPIFGIYWYNRSAYEKRKAEFLRTGDKRFLTREISLHAPDLEERMRSQFRRTAGDLALLRPFAYYLADESSVTCYADAFDVDWSPQDLAAFRVWLKSRYASLRDLNQAWGVLFQDWEEVLPMTSAEAQSHGNFAPWAEHRIFMEEAFIRAIEKAGKVAREFDSEARASFSGTQIPSPHNGCNWHAIDQVADYLQPYSGGNQDAMHHLFRPGLPLTGFTGYGSIGEAVQHQVWSRLFYGHSGASIFWHYTLLNPDLTLSAQGAALAKAFGHMQDGIGRIFMNSSVQEDGVAIHFSMASIRGSWITDGKIVDHVVSADDTSANFAELMKRRDQWVGELEARGLQFRFLATSQIEAGELDAYKVLVLPYSIAISERERQAIESFAARGRLVYLDEQAGRMDELNRWRPRPLWESLPSGFVRGAPADLKMRHDHPFDGVGLLTVRKFGDSDLIGFLPAKAEEVRLPRSVRHRYDLLRGGLAAGQIRLSGSEPALLLERSTRIADLKVSPTLEFTLTDEQGQGVDRSVVAVEVIAPDGSVVPYYSGNLDIRDGKGRFSIPFALSDGGMGWKVRARDVVSGLTAEVFVRADGQ